MPNGQGNAPQVNHPLYNILKLQPNSRMSSYDWRVTIEGHRSGWGNGYAWVQRNPDKSIAGLELLFPDKTEPKVVDGTLVYQTDVGGQRVTLPGADVIHVHGMGYDGLRGYSPARIARESLGLGIAIHEFGGRFFSNGATPKGVIESEVPSNALIKWQEEFSAKFGSLENSHGTPILPKGLTYKPLSINPDDAQVLETMKYNRTEIAGLYRVPAQFIGDLERSTFTNAIEMDSHFTKHTMVPIFTSYEQELNSKLLTAAERRRGFFVKFNMGGLLRGDQASRYGAYHLALQDGWMERNEIRQLEDLSSVDEIDGFLQPTNMIDADTTIGQITDMIDTEDSDDA